jgi:hypothetical protein
MKRFVMRSIIKMVVDVIFLTMIVALVIAGIGYLNKWDSTITYSNAFFIAGSLLIAAGGMSKMAAGQEWGAFQMISSESFRGMSSGERANYILEVSSSWHLVILGFLSGIVLILISVIVA